MLTNLWNINVVIVRRLDLMNRNIPNGVWPTMVTPFTVDNEIDYVALEELIEWFLQNDVAGLFAVCQSSEMYYLTEKEQLELAKFVVKTVNGRVPVASSGHVSNDLQKATDNLKSMADTGVDALVLVTGNIAAAEESDAVWRSNIELMLKQLPDIPLGLYECPTPYKRLVSPETLQWCAQTKRFLFFKDTCCELEMIEAKLAAVEGTDLKIFNANAATLLASLQLGASGYCGVMANFHPSLYVWLVEHFLQDPETAQNLQNFLGLASVIEMQCYPKNAKYHCQLSGIPMELKTRNPNCPELRNSLKLEVEQLYALGQQYIANLDF